MIGNKNLLDPIVSGTQPSPESTALRSSQQPFMITTIYRVLLKVVPKGWGRYSSRRRCARPVRDRQASDGARIVH